MAQGLQSAWVVVSQVRALKETVYRVKAHYVRADDGSPSSSSTGAARVPQRRAAGRGRARALNTRSSGYARGLPASVLLGSVRAHGRPGVVERRSESGPLSDGRIC